MFDAPETPAPSVGRRLAVVAILFVAIAAGIGIVVWRPSLVGLGSKTSEPAPVATNTGRASAPSTTPDKDQLGVFETSAGRIVIEFLPDVAPKHTVAFQNMFRSGFFDGTRFHRVLPKQAVQGGGPNSKDDYPYDDGLVLETQRRIPAEFSTKVHHVRGVVSAAHSDGDPDSATSQFFISVASNPRWDGQYTIFARVVEGIEIVDRMASAPLLSTPGLRDRPTEPVRVTRAYLVARGDLTPAP